MTSFFVASRSESFRRGFSAVLLALLVAVLWSPVARADPSASSAAIRRVLEERARQAPTLARATATLHGSLERSRDLAAQARSDLQSGILPAESDALNALFLERHTLEIAYSTVLAGMDGRAATERGRSSVRDRRRSKSIARGDRAPRKASLENVRKLVDLQEQLETSARGANRIGAASIVREIEREVGQALRVVQRSEPRESRVVRQPAPEVRRDPIPLSAVNFGPVADVAVTDVPSAESTGVQSTPEITALAAELDFDPLAIYLHVRNNFRFEIYFGCLKGAQATLETGGGNDYDLAALTASLLQAAGYSTRFARGTAIIPADDMLAWLGLEDPAAANVILNTPGITAVPVVNGPDIIFYRVDRLWTEVEAPVFKAGGEMAWFPLDTAFKRHDLSPGVPGLLATVPFDEATYLSAARTELAWEFYQQQLRDYLETNLPGTAVSDVPLGMVRIEDHPSKLPASLPYQLASFDAIYSAIPASLSHKATVRVRHLASTILSHQVVIPDMALQRFTLSYIVEPADQAIVDGFGGLANTPPGAADVIPQLKLDGAVVAQGSARPYLDSASLEVDFFKPEGDLFDGTADHSIRIGEWAGIGIDAYQISETHLQRQTQTVVDAIALEDGGGTADPDELIGAFLYLAILQYHADVETGDSALADLAQFRRVKLVSQGIASGNQEIFSIGGTNFTTVPGALVVDVPRLNSNNFALDDDNTLQSDLRWAIGLNGSAQEHSLWEGYLNLPGISTIKSLQLANVAGIPVFVIDDTDVDPTNDCSVLCPQLTLGATTVAGIASDVAAGSAVTVPRDPTPLNDWTGVGYITANQTTGSTGYIISGGLNSSNGAGPGNAELLSGGAVTVVIIDGQTYVVSVGPTGDVYGSSYTGDPVNISNGNFFREETDFAVPALGEGFGFLRAYNSQSTFDGSLGLGWAHNYIDRLAVQPDMSVIWIDGRGTAHTFQPDVTPGTFVSPPGSRETLVDTGGGFTLSRHTGNVQTFDVNGRLISRVDRNGNTCSLAYDGSDRLSTVTDPASRTLTFSYTATDKVATVSDFSGRTWTYTYDGIDQLASVTSPSGADTLALVTQYTYDGAGRLQTITEPNGGVRDIRYYSNGRVARVTDPLGHPMTLVYNAFKSETRVTDARGLTSVHGFNSVGNQTSLTHPDGTIERWTWVDNRITSRTDPLGNTQNFTFDPQGNRSSLTDGAGMLTQLTYEAPFSNLKTVVRPGPVQMTYTYDGNGNLIQVLDAEGKTRTQINNAQGLPETLTDARGNVVTLTYNGAGQVLTRTTQLPSTETTTYDLRGTASSFTDGNGHTTNYTYDLLGRALTTTDAETNVTESEYDAGGRLVRSVDARSGVTEYFYDLNNNLVRQVSADGTEIRFEYDGVGNQIAFTDELGRTTRQQFDNRGRAIRVIRPDGSVLRTEYDAAGRIAAEIDALGSKTRFEYDGAGHLVKTIDPELNETVRAYDGNGRLVSITEPGLSLTTMKYDGLDRLTEIRGEGGRVETLDYDENGNVVDKTRYDVAGLGSIPSDPRTLPAARKRTITQTYDVLNRLETITDPESGLTTNSYDNTKNILTITDPRGKTTTFAYDMVDRPVSVTRPDTGELTYGYDPSGNMISLTLPEGGIYSWTYDARNRPLTFTDPLGLTTGYNYDLTGKVAQQTHADGTWVRNSYDSLGRLRHVVRSDDSFTDKVYDPAGNLARASTERTELTFAYDTRNLRTSEILAIDGTVVGGTVGYTWDATKNLAGVTDPTGRTLSYDRDLAHRLTLITDDAAGPTRLIDYNGWGEPQTLTYGNGTAGAVDFDKNGRVTQIDWTDPIARFDYIRDPAGNPTQIDEALGGALESLSLVYDDLSRPVSSTATTNPGSRSETFAYDFDGDLINPGAAAPVSFNVADQPVVDASGRTFSYDQLGNRTAREDSGGLRLETPHDPSSRYAALRSLSSGVVTRDLRLTYDGLDRLVEIEEGGSVRRFVHAIGNPIVEYDGGGTPDVLYSVGPDTDDYFGLVSAGTLSYLHRDTVGSVRAVTNNVGGFVGGRNFGQFGRLQTVAGSPATDLGFSGRFFDAPTGLVYARARLYDPDTAAFLSRDALGFENILKGQSPSMYAWAKNMPGLFVDPLGLSPEPSWWQQALDNAGLFFSGAGEAAWDFAYETLATTYDLEQVVYYSITGDLDGFQATSSIGTAAEGGAGTGDILWATAEGVVQIPWEWGQSLVSGDPERIGRATFNFELALYAAGRGELSRPINGQPVITNPVPARLARVIEGEGPFQTLGRPGAADVFVTAADDIAGLNASQLAQRLTIPGANQFTVIEFPTPANGLASPVFRTNPGFVGGGLTAGGAAEFVIPNGPIPPGAIIRIIGQ